MAGVGRLFLTKVEAMSDIAAHCTVRQKDLKCDFFTFIHIQFRNAVITRMLVAAIALAALLVAPQAAALLLVLACAAGGAWALRADQAPAAQAITAALHRSRTAMGELEASRGSASAMELGE